MHLPEKQNEKTKHRLQFITNQWSETPLAEQVEEACKAGCRWIQLRLKEIPYEKWMETAQTVQTICNSYNATFIINDNVDIAMKTDADGVHLGKDDMCPEKARELLGKDKIIGGTANTLNDILQLVDKGVDYVGLGPFRATLTKKKLSPILGLEGYEMIMKELEKRKINIPVIAIGGIGEDDIENIINTGMSGIAISSLISHHNNPQQITGLLLEKINTLCYK